MNTGSTLLVLTITLILCQYVTEVESRRTTSTSRRGSSNRRNNYGSSHQGSTGFFGSFFGSGKKTGTSSGSGSSSTGTKSSGWTSAGQASKTSGSQNPGWANPYYKPSAPKQPSGYGWTTANKKPDTAATQFQKSSQPSSNIGAGGYPVQSGFQQSGRTPQHGFNTAQQSHGFNTGQQSHGYNAAPQSHGFNTAQQSHGFNTAQQPHGYNSAPQSHGYNTMQQSHGYNPSQQTHGYHPQPSYNQPSYNQHSYNQPSYQSGGNIGGYHPSNNYGHQGFASSHGISPNAYPSQNSFGYPGQGLFGGAHGPKYGGQSLFGGGTGNFGYPGGNAWGVPSYGSKVSSGKGKLLTGLALGAAGGYLTSSLVNKISNPWGYSGYGYGSRFGYDRPIIIKEIRETTKTETPAAPAPNQEPDPTENWIHCVAFDPTTNTTLINPNCSCTVTTVIDPMTGLPISTHNCTTANGQVLPPQPVGMPPPVYPAAEPLPPNAVNTPNASPSYGGLYQDNMRYGAGLPVENPAKENAEPAKLEVAPLPTTESEVSSTTSDADMSTTGPTVMNDSPGSKEGGYESAKIREFYSQLEQITSMGKFL